MAKCSKSTGPGPPLPHITLYGMPCRLSAVLPDRAVLPDPTRSGPATAK